METRQTESRLTSTRQAERRPTESRPAGARQRLPQARPHIRRLEADPRGRPPQAEPKPLVTLRKMSPRRTRAMERKASHEGTRGAVRVRHALLRPEEGA